MTTAAGVLRSMAGVENPDENTYAPGVEIETLTAFDQAVAAGTLAGHRVQSVDLRDRGGALLTTDTRGAVFLGCPMEPRAEAKIRADGAFVFPPVPGLPFDPYRGLLYTPDALYEGLAEGATGPPRTHARTTGSSGPGRTATSSPRCCERSTTTPSPTPWTNTSPGHGWWA